MTVPVLGEDADSRRVVGAIGHIDDLHLGNQAQEEAPDPLLALWESTDTNDTTDCWCLINICMFRFHW